MGQRHGGASLHDHLASVARQLGRKMPAAPALPPEVRHLWQTFLELHRTRPAGFGASPIAFAEIDAWSRLKRTPLDPWEVDAIVALDREWMDAQAGDSETAVNRDASG